MITGIVDQQEAVVELAVLDDSNRPHRIRAIVDTGYNGSLTLPSDLVSALRLRRAGQRRALLADGTEIVLSEFIATVLWHDEPHQVSVTQTEGGVLIGMGLLEGCRLTIDVVAGGEVRIENLSVNPN